MPSNTPRFDFLKPDLDPNDIWGEGLNENWDKADAASKQTDMMAASGTLQTQLDSHTGDSSIHFTEGSIDHTAIQNVGSNTHAAIDTHIADGTKHFTEGSIDHTNIQNVGSNTHAQIDSHISDSTIHLDSDSNESVDGIWDFPNGVTVSGFPVSTGTGGGGSGNILDINGETGSITIDGSDGNTVNTAAQTITVQGFRPEFLTASGSLQTQIDTNESNLSSHTGDATIHFTEGSIDHTAIQNIGSNTHAQIDAHLAALAVSGTQHLSNVVEDTSPQLGGDLDAQNNDLDNVDSVNANTINATTVASTNGSYTTSLTVSGTPVMIDSGAKIVKGNWEFESGATVSGSSVLTSASSVAPALTVKEEDASPNVSNVDTLIFSNDSVTDNGDGSVTIDVGAGAGTITDINTSAVGPSVTVTGAGAVETITNGNTIVVSGTGPGVNVVESLNTLDGDLTLSVTQNLSIGDNGSDTITITGPDLSTYATITLVTTTSGFLQTQLDTHTGDSTIHFTEASIDHTNIQNIGSNSHAQIDSHLENLAISGTENRDLIVTTSGHLQGQIDGLDVVDSLNSLTGDVTVVGGGDITVTVDGQEITVSGADQDNVAQYTHTQSTPADEWVVEHDLGHNYPQYSIWKVTGSTHETFQPDRVVASGANASRVFFSEEIEGWASFSIGKGANGSVINHTEQQPGMIGFPVDEKSYPIDPKSFYDYNMDSIWVATSTGTLKATLAIDGTPVTNGQHMSVSTTGQTITLAAPRQVLTGSRVTLTTSGFTGIPQDFEFNIESTRLSE